MNLLQYKPILHFFLINFVKISIPEFSARVLKFQILVLCIHVTPCFNFHCNWMTFSRYRQGSLSSPSPVFSVVQIDHGVIGLSIFISISKSECTHTNGPISLWSYKPYQLSVYLNSSEGSEASSFGWWEVGIKKNRIQNFGPLAPKLWI